MRAIWAAVLMAGALPGAAMATTVLNSDALLTGGGATLNSVTVGGRVMVGGDLNGQGISAGTNLNSSANGTTVVGVNGNINSPQVSASYGNVVYGGANNTPGWGPVSVSQGQTVSQGTTSASSDFAQAVQISHYLAGQASTGTESISTDGSRVLTLAGSNAGLNIYNISASDLTANQQINIVGGLSAIINVVGNLGSNYTYLNFSTSLTANNILFNFVDATSINFNASNLPASILAPLADVTVQNNVQGDVIGKTITANGLTIGGSGYSGDLAGYSASGSQVAAVPEPASWLALIAGFGLVGGVIRRGRSRGLPWLAKR